MVQKHLIRRREERRRKPLPECHGGLGTLDCSVVLDRENGATGRLRFIHDDILPPGASIGMHRHEEDEEYYYILSGSGIMVLDDEQFEIREGDITAVFPGGAHGLENHTQRNLRVLVISVSLFKDNARPTLRDLGHR